MKTIYRYSAPITMLTPAEIEKVKKILKDLKDEIEIVVVPNKDWKRFEDFAKVLSDISDKVSYIVEDREGLLVKPALILKKGNRENIIYHAIPIKEELEPFLKTIVMLSKGVEMEEVRDLDAKVIVFVTPICPHCAKVVEAVNNFAVASPNVKSMIVDASMFLDLMQKYDVTSAPTTIINDEIRLTGYVSRDVLLNWLKKAKGEYKKDYFITLLNERRLDEIKDIIAKNPEDVKVLAELLAYEEFMVRFGAMVIMEQIAKENPEIVKLAKDIIRRHLKHDDFRIREDVAMLLGSIGDESDVEFLEELLKEKGEVRDSAIEAIEEIKRRR